MVAMATFKPDTRRRLELWLQRPETKRTGDDVLIFYGWLCPASVGTGGSVPSLR